MTMYRGYKIIITTKGWFVVTKSTAPYIYADSMSGARGIINVLITGRK